MRMEESRKNLIRCFIGKKIEVDHYLDYSYRIDGDPQYNRVARINGETVFDAHKDIEIITREQLDALKGYGYRTDNFTRTPNGEPGYFDVYYSFILNEEVLKSL